MEHLWTILAAAGLWLLWRRWPPLPSEKAVAGARPRVSIIVPARNEALVLGDLLSSLQAIDYPDFEIIVVDDNSDDGTAAIAKRAEGRRVGLVEGRMKPTDWGGKQWACHQGAQAATGDILLFTDADTVHAPDSLRRSVSEMVANDASMLSCLPYHSGTSWWERLSGPFHVLLLTITAPWGTPRPRRLFAIGQYLMFTRTAYDRIGGHEAVKTDLVEDLPLANLCLSNGLNYRVLRNATPLFHVRMYATFADFLRGWRRNFRAGLSAGTWRAPLEVVAIMAALVGAGNGGLWILGLASYVVAVTLMARAQRRLGRFSILGAVFFPFGAGLFCVATLLAVFDMTARRPTLWKGRAYVV